MNKFEHVHVGGPLALGLGGGGGKLPVSLQLRGFHVFYLYYLYSKDRYQWQNFRKLAHPRITL